MYLIVFIFCTQFLSILCIANFSRYRRCLVSFYFFFFFAWHRFLLTSSRSVLPSFSCFFLFACDVRATKANQFLSRFGIKIPYYVATKPVHHYLCTILILKLKLSLWNVVCAPASHASICTGYQIEDIEGMSIEWSRCSSKIEMYCQSDENENVTEYKFGTLRIVDSWLSVLCACAVCVCVLFRWPRMENNAQTNAKVEWNPCLSPRSMSYSSIKCIYCYLYWWNETDLIRIPRNALQKFNSIYGIKFLLRLET